MGPSFFHPGTLGGRRVVLRCGHALLAHRQRDALEDGAVLVFDERASRRRVTRCTSDVPPQVRGDVRFERACGRDPMIRKAALGTRREQLVNDCLLSLAQFLGRVASDDKMPHDCARSEETGVTSQ